MILFTKEVIEALRKTNYQNMVPVVKIFNPVGAGVWLLTHMEPPGESEEGGEFTVCWGYCDIGKGQVEYGTVGKEELESMIGPLNMRLERDLHWEPIPGMDYSDVLQRRSMREGPY